MITRDKINIYTAGIFDGEGCVSIAKGKKGKKYSKPNSFYHKLYVCVTNGSANLIKFLYQNYGGHIYSRVVRSPRHKPCYKWGLTQQEAEDFLKELLPYLIVKKEQAELALLLRETVDVRNRRNGGGLPQRTVNIREILWYKMRRLNSDVSQSQRLSEETPKWVKRQSELPLNELVELVRNN